jgi:hypothetical protein
VTTTILIALALLIAIGARYLRTGPERCPDCNEIRETDTPICSCGWIFEVPDDDMPLEYGDPTDET